jgi:type IV pilus assembly protein PilM
LFSRRLAVTGLDLGRRSVKLVRLEGGSRPRLTHWGIEELPLEGDGSPAEQGEALERLLTRLALKPRALGRVAALVGGRDVQLRQASLPALPEDELRRALPYEARKHLPLENVTSACLDFQLLNGVAGSGDAGQAQTREALLAAAPLARRNDVLTLLDGAGIEPEVLDAKPLPALNAVLEAHPPDEGTSWTVVLDLGGTTSTLAAVLPEGTFYYRLLEFASDALTEAIEREFHLDVPSAERVKVALRAEALEGGERWVETPLKGLLRELEETFRFLGLRHRSRSVSRLYVFGGGALLHGLRDRLARDLQVEVVHPDPFQILAGISGERPSPGESLRLVEALGLARWWD